MFEFIVDTYGIEVLLEYSHMEIRRKEKRILMGRSPKVNFTTLVAEKMGHHYHDIKTAELITEEFNFSSKNIKVKLLKEKPDYKFVNTDTLTPNLIVEPTSLGDYLKRIFRINEHESIIEFSNIRNIVQTLVSNSCLDGLDIRRLSPSFRFNETHWRINYTTKDGNKLKFSRYLLEYSGDDVVDHINRNPLDNRKDNLRIISQSRNMHNMGSKAKNSSYIKGVTFNKTNNSVYSRIIFNGVKYSKIFPVNKYGFDKAVKLATEKRREWNKRFNVEE